MFFVIFIVIHYWLDFVLKPLLFHPSFYFLIISWLAFMSLASLLYFRLIDAERFDRLKIVILKSALRAALIGVLVPTFLTGIYLFGTVLTYQSLFFHQQRFNINKLISLFIDFNGMFVLGWFRVFALFFFIISSLKMVKYLKENLFHLQEDRRERLFSWIVIGVAALSYLFVKIFGKI